MSLFKAIYYLIAGSVSFLTTTTVCHYLKREIEVQKYPPPSTSTVIFGKKCYYKLRKNQEIGESSPGDKDDGDLPLYVFLSDLGMPMDSLNYVSFFFKTV